MAQGIPTVSYNGYSNAPGYSNPNGVVNPGESSAIGSAHEVASLPSFVAKDGLDAKFSGKMTQGDYFAHLLEQQSAREAREWEKAEADSAWQRKVADLEKAGFSPLAALDASGQGAAVASSQVAKATSSGSSLQLGAILGAIVGAIGIIASKGAAAAATAKNAVALEGIKQSNREALAKFYSNAAKDRAKYSAKAAMARATIKKGRVINKGPYGYIEDIFYGL